MASTPTLVQNEPVISALIVNVVTVGISLAVALGLDLSAEASAGLVAFVNAVVNLASAIYARSRVTPVGKKTQP